jgi:hypothetical protein
VSLTGRNCLFCSPGLPVSFIFLHNSVPLMSTPIKLAHSGDLVTTIEDERASSLRTVFFLHERHRDQPADHDMPCPSRDAESTRKRLWSLQPSVCQSRFDLESFGRFIKLNLKPPFRLGEMRASRYACSQNVPKAGKFLEFQNFAQTKLVCNTSTPAPRSTSI